MLNKEQFTVHSDTIGVKDDNLGRLFDKDLGTFFNIPTPHVDLYFEFPTGFTPEKVTFSLNREHSIPVGFYVENGDEAQEFLFDKESGFPFFQTFHLDKNVQGKNIKLHIYSDKYGYHPFQIVDISFS